MIRRLTVWGLGVAGLCGAGCVEPARLEGQWTALGRPASAEVYAVSERDARALLAAFPEAMRRVESTMSLTAPDSEMNRINLEAPRGYYRVQDRDLFRAVALALDYAKATEGAFDPTIGPVQRLYEVERPGLPDDSAIEMALEHVGWSRVVLERGVFAVHFPSSELRIDLAGLIDGYALDVAARKFVRTGSRGGLLRLGHQIYVWGLPPGQQAWSVDVRDPRSPQEVALLRLSLSSSRGIGVSGSGGEAQIVLDPRTGKPAASDTLVAVAVADSAADAVAVSRALLVGGSTRAGTLLTKTRRVEALLLVRGDPEPYWIASASLADRVQSSAGEARLLLPPAEL